MSGHVEGCCRQKSWSRVTAPDRALPLTRSSEDVLDSGVSPATQPKEGSRPVLATQLFLVKRSTILSEVAGQARGSRETTLVGDLSESWPPV